MFKQLISRRRMKFPARKTLRLNLLLLLPLWAQSAHSPHAQAFSHRAFINQSSPRQSQQGTPTQDAVVTPLTPGRAVGHEISGGQKQSYQVAAAAGQFVGVVVRQDGTDVGVKVFAPDGKLAAEFDSESMPQGEEEADFVAETAGAYRLDVTAQVKGTTGRYEIRVTEVRAATEHDRALDEAHRLSTRALYLLAAAKYAEALPLAERALELGEKELGPEHTYVAYLLVEVGGVYSDKGNYAQAERLLKRALDIDQRALGLTHPQTVSALHDLGVVYSRTNEYGKAEELLQQSLTLTEQTLGAGHPRVVRILRDLSVLHYRRADMARSEQEMKRALDIADKTLAPDDFVLSQVLSNLGLLYVSNREYDRAEPLLQRALEIAEKRFGPESSQLSLPLQNLALIAQQQKKDYPRALELYWRAEKNLEKAVGPEHPQVAAILNNIANIYKVQGDYAHALELHQRVHAIFEKSLGPYHGNTLVSLGNIASTYAAMGETASAVKFQALTDEAVEKNLALNLAIGSERQKLAFFDSLSERTERTISLHVNHAPNDSAARDLAAQDILQRKGRVLDAMSGSLAALRQRLNGEDRALLDQLNTTTAQLAKLALAGRGNTPPAEYQRQLASLTEQKEQLEAEISRRSAEFRAQSQPVTLTAVESAIPPGAALVEFAAYRPFDPKINPASEAFGEPRYVAYVIRPQGEVGWRELGSAREVDARVEALRAALSDPRRGDVQQLARAVDEKVFQPVRALLGETRQLLVSPDGELNLLPFAALVDEEGRYLVERYSFTYLTSGRDLLRLQVRRESKSPPVVVADPAFGAPALIAASDRAGTKSSSGEGARPQVDYSQIFFGPLPGVTDEVRALKDLLPQASFLTREQATKAAMEKLSGPVILHIATHGFFLQAASPATAEKRPAAQTKPVSRLGKLDAHVENPLLRSGLALAGANQSGNGNSDGILTALEASGLDLWGTKLVVLSACDTGFGEVKNGEGVYGLRRALVLAGAESQVMSLWAVSDRSTRDLIVGYYQALMRGAGRGEALRRVQLHMLGDKAHRHPYYWAGFIQTGEWGNLEGRR
ncbi:MAG: CHAT domain-containing protein [Acidobacteria bacterium]|nr:CHAT domain-containing protein [Acidobacteriota bacterium]